MRFGVFYELQLLAVVVAFLLSDDASFVSGIDVLVDGANLPGIDAAAR